MRWIALLAVLIATIAMPEVAVALEPPEACLEGPAREASLQRPHFVDPPEDATTARAPLDLRAVWISQRQVPAWFETSGHVSLLSYEGNAKISQYPRAYRANIQVADIPSLPFTATYVVELATNEGPRFVSAERMPVPGGTPVPAWRFDWGVVEPDGSLTYKGWSTGEVTGNTIGVDLVGFFQTWNEDYSENSVSITRVRSTVPVGTDYDALYDDVPWPDPVLVTADEGGAEQACKAVLWAQGEEPNWATLE